MTLELIDKPKATVTCFCGTTLQFTDHTPQTCDCDSVWRWTGRVDSGETDLEAGKDFRVRITRDPSSDLTQGYEELLKRIRCALHADEDCPDDQLISLANARTVATFQHEYLVEGMVKLLGLSNPDESSRAQLSNLRQSLQDVYGRGGGSCTTQWSDDQFVLFAKKGYEAHQNPDESSREQLSKLRQSLHQVYANTRKCLYSDETIVMFAQEGHKAVESAQADRVKNATRTVS